MNILTFIKHVISACKNKKRKIVLHDINNIIYIYCIKSIQIKGTISPLEKFNWLATPSGPQINEVYQVLNDYSKNDIHFEDNEELDDRSKRILDYVIYKYYHDPNIQSICKGEAYYSAIINYDKFNINPKTGKVVYTNQSPLIEWLDIYQEARSDINMHRDKEYLTKNSENNKSNIEKNEKSKLYSKISISSDHPLALTIYFDNKKQFKEFIDKLY